MKKAILYILLAAFTLASCEKIAMTDPDTDAHYIFEYLWNRVDRQYAHFDVKNVDWDSVHDHYDTLIYSGMPDDSLFLYLGQMLNSLNDGHVNLRSAFDLSFSEEIFLQTYGNRNYNSEVVNLNYLGPHYHTSGGLLHNSLRDGKVIYIRYSSFSNSAATSLLNHVINYYPDAQGLILDIRQNGGGSFDNVWNILKLLPAHHILLYRTQIKSGPAHNDFTPLEEVYSDFTNDGYTAYYKPFVILTDRGSYSASSFFALCSKAYDNMLLMGDTTGGGLGIPNGGELPNGWTYRFSITRTLSPDGRNFENGVPPDSLVLLDPSAVASGKDNIIETACDYILSQSK